MATRLFEALPKAPTVDSAIDEIIEKSVGFFEPEAGVVAVSPEATLRRL